jgi:hypothetical protein
VNDRADALMFLDEDTGEIVQPDNADLTMAALAGYAEAKVALDLARSDRAAYLARLAQTDPTLRAFEGREQLYASLVEGVEDALAGVFSDDL